MLLDMPLDIQSNIFSLLDLAEIACVRQTCSTLNMTILGDKQLWLHFFCRDIQRCGLPTPKSRTPLDIATSQDVMEWVKNGIILNKNYLTGYNETLSRADLSFHVTWTKIVRSHWILVAYSNLQLSKLTVWDLQNTQPDLRKATFHFSGPITEALLEDDGSEILIAFTIGRKYVIYSLYACMEPYELRRDLDTILCSLFVFGAEVRLQKVCELAGFAFARFIQRPYIGFAQRNGDDTYPYVLDWESRLMRALIPPSLTFPTDETPGWVGHEPCTGMFLWKGYIFALFPHELVIYEDYASHDEANGCLLSHIASAQVCPLKRWAFISATVVNAEVRMHDPSSNDELHLVMRSGHGRIFAYTVRYEQASDPSKRFALKRTGYFQLFETTEDVFKATKLSVGPSCGQFVVHVLDQTAWHKSLLYMAPIVKQDGSITFGKPVLLDMKGLPLLFEMSSMDFDDGVGILVFGMRDGRVYVKTFGNKVPLTYLRSELPALDAPSDFYEQVPFDLPLIYRLSESSQLEAFREEVIEICRTWQDESSAPQIPGWSSDWSKFKNISQWIMPHPRWGLLDTFYKRKTVASARVRLRIGTLSDIIPVMYDESNHYRVLFRIGSRLYYCKSRKPITDEDHIDFDFDELPHSDILGMLPLSYPQFLVSGIQTFRGVISDYWTQRNIDTSMSTDADKDCLDRIWMYTTVKDALVKYCGKYPGDETLKTWTKEEWNGMRRVSVGLKGQVPSNCRIASTSNKEGHDEANE